MHKKSPNIALLSPNQNAYSETFIQAHKNHLKGKVYYYFGLLRNAELEGTSTLRSLRKKIFFGINRFLRNKNYKWYLERFIIASFRAKKIDVVLAEYGHVAQVYLSVIVEMNLPLIVHFHGYDASKRTLIQKNNNYKQIFEYATFVVAVSKKMHADLLEMGCPEDKVIYNVYGPNDIFYAINPTFTKQQFVSVGRFVDKKAPYYLILSLLEVVEQFPEVKLIMGGDGDLLETCKNLSRFYKLDKNMEFRGIIKPEEFRGLLQGSLAFVQHSITSIDGNTEGTPLTVLEASAAGVPVLSTKHAGIPDVIKDGETGLLVDEHDVSGMANYMIELLKEPSRAKEMGQKGKENIRKNFNLNRHIETLDDLMAKATNQKLKRKS